MDTLQSDFYVLLPFQTRFPFFPAFLESATAVTFVYPNGERPFLHDFYFHDVTWPDDVRPRWPACLAYSSDVA
jgi:hypothetical protein